MLVEIRAPRVTLAKIESITVIKDVPYNIDDSLPCAVVMAKNDLGQLVEAIKGDKEVFNFCKYGYNRISKACPLMLFRKCKCEKCAWYFIDQGTGDCSMVWQAIRK
jgi:hypothetical protein